MIEPFFLSVRRVLQIHADQIVQYGGAPEIRDVGLLESAIAAVRATFDGIYLCRDLCEFAAAYLFYIVKNHPFVDGNKRTATASALVFLKNNGFEVEEGDDLTQMVYGVVDNTVGKEELAAFFRTHLFITQN